MKLLTKAEEREIKKDIKRRTKEDLKLYKRLYELFKQVYELESGEKVNIEKVKQLEEEILRIFNKIRRDILAELDFLDMLKPKDDMEKAILLAFGPFLPPLPKDARPKHIRELRKYLTQEGFEIAFIEEEKGRPPTFKARYKGHDLGVIEPTPKGFDYIFERAEKIKREPGYASALKRESSEIIGVKRKKPEPEYAAD